MKGVFRMALVEVNDILSRLDGLNDRENGDEHFLNGIETAREVIATAPAVDVWHRVEEGKLPENMHVLARCEITGLYKPKFYTCVAFHAPKFGISAGRYPDDDCCYEYNEEDDEYYLQEGWYEVIRNWDEYGSVAISDSVIGWMPLPPASPFERE